MLLVALVCLVAGATWLVKTERGMLWTLDVLHTQLERHLKQSFQIEGAKGNFWDGLTAKRLEWSDGKTTVDIDALALEINWAALQRPTLDIRKLQAKRVDVKTTPDPDSPPLVLPKSIDLPMNIELANLSVEVLQINAMAMTKVAGQASLKGHQLDLSSLNLQVQDAQVQAIAKATLAQPYALDGVVSFSRSFEDLKADAKLDVSGNLDALNLSLDALGQDKRQRKVNQTVRATAVVSPFARLKVRQLQAEAHQFNPHQWLNTAPSALLDVKLNVQPNADFSRVDGDLTLQNRIPDSIQRQGLPVRKLYSEFVLLLKDQLPESAHADIKTLQFAKGTQSAGAASGRVDWRAQQSADMPGFGSISADFHLSALNLNVFADLPKPVAIQGQVKIRQAGQVVHLDTLDLSDGPARVSGTGQLTLKPSYPVSLKAQFVHLNPAAYLPKSAVQSLLKGDLNGQTELDAVLFPAGAKRKALPDGRVSLDVAHSSLAGSPLLLQLHAQAQGQRVELKQLDVNVVGNTLNAKGAYGGQGDSLDLQARLHRLPELGRAIGQTLAGTLDLDARVHGQGNELQADWSVNANQLRWQSQFSLAKAQGQFQMGLNEHSAWTGQLALSDLRVQPPQGDSQQWLNSLNLQLAGTRSAHTLTGSFVSGMRPFTRRNALEGAFALSGGVRSDKRGNMGWQGLLSRLQVKGLWRPVNSLTLAQPVSLKMGGGELELGKLVMKGEDDTRIQSDLLRVQGKNILSRGSVGAITLPRISPILRKQMSLEPKALKLKAAWSYEANPGKVDGHVQVEHLSGGLQVLEDSEVEVAIRTLKANLDFDRQGVRLALDFKADQFGVLQANLMVPVEKDSKSAAWHVAANKPMQGYVAASLSELGWLGPLINTGVRTSGYGQIALAIAGTAEAPQVQGRLFARNLDIYQLDQGTRLEDGTVTVDLNNDRAKIEDATFTVYNRQAPRGRLEELGPLIQGAGKISASGQWNLTGMNGGLDIKVDRAALLQRPDRWMMVNANVAVRQPVQAGGPLKVTGSVDALGAYIESPEQSVQTLGEDVVIRGQSGSSGKSGALDVNVRINLGKLFFLNAQGLKTRLDGGLQLTLQDGLLIGNRRTGRRLQANGTIQAVDGTYRAYGQDLTIVRGVVNFQGPLDNPGLNVRAVRKGVAVEAGVEITGSAQRPRVTLVSDPAVPDSEKLSWMIIGRGSNSSDRDSTILLTAAAALFGDSDDSTTRKIAKSLGIDDFTLSSGSLTAADSRAVGSKVAIAPGADESAVVTGADDPLLSQRIVSLGKRLSDKVYVSFDESLTTAANILKLNYQYSRRLSLIARTGADNAVDVLYQFSFD